MNSQHSKQVFMDALKVLLKQKNIDNIYVNEICKQAGMSKRSFYYHFRDKYDLAHALYESIICDTLSDSGDIGNSYFEAQKCGLDCLTDADETAIEKITAITHLWNVLYHDISLNLTISNDKNGLDSYWDETALEGRKNLILRRLAAVGKTLSDFEIEYYAGLLCFTSRYYYEYWDKKYARKAGVTKEDAAQLVMASNKLLEFILSQAK